MTTDQLIAEFDRVINPPSLAEAIVAGQKACDAFSAAVAAAGYKSRWDNLDLEKHPALKAARDAHHAAGQTMHEAFVRSRSTT